MDQNIYPIKSCKVSKIFWPTDTHTNICIHTHTYTYSHSHVYTLMQNYIGNKLETRHPFATATSNDENLAKLQAHFHSGNCWTTILVSTGLFRTSHTDRQSDTCHGLLLTESPWPHFLHAEFASKITFASSCLRGFQAGAAGENRGVCQRCGINSPCWEMRKEADCAKGSRSANASVWRGTSNTKVTRTQRNRVTVIRESLRKAS